MRSRSAPWWLVLVAVIAAAVFGALTLIVTTNRWLELDSQAFAVASDVRAPWLTTAARVITTLGLIATVGPVMLLGAGLLTARTHRPRAVVLVAGAALAWLTVWMAKALVDRPRPLRSLVHTSGQSYPSAHAANSIGWLALAAALVVVIPARAGRVALGFAGVVIPVLVGFSRIYLRAHFASDVLAGYSLAVAMYALAAILVIGSRPRRAFASSSAAATTRRAGVSRAQ